MNCGRRSAVDDVRSRRTRAVDEDRRRIRWAVDEDRHRRRWAIDDDRRRRRREIDDYPPLELPLQWRDPPPEYPPLELPLKWRNPLPDHLVRNQPAAFARDSPSLRPQLVAHDPYAASSRNPTRNPDPLIPDFNSHRRRRNADRAQCRENLRWAEVEASIDRTDALCANVLQSVDRIMSRPATIPTPSLIRSTNTQAQSNLLPPANNHSGADVDSLSTPPATISTPQNPTAIAESTGTEKLLEDVKNPQSTLSEDIYNSAEDIYSSTTTSTPKTHVADCSIEQIFSMPEIPTPPEDISSFAVTTPPVLPAQTEYPLQAPVTDAFLDSDPTSSKGSSDLDGEIESSPFRSAGSTIMAGDEEVLPSARASPLSTSAADASLSGLVERASGYGIVSLATEVEASAEHDSEADGTATPPDQLPSSSTSSFSFGSALSSTCKFHPSRLSRAFYMPLALKFSWLKEDPPLAVLQTARVLSRRNVLSYRFPLEKLGNYYVVIYFAGVLPVSSVFDVLFNGNVVNLDYHVSHAEVSSIVYLAKAVDKVKVSFRNVSFYPQVNGIEIYEVVKIPPECLATTVSALQVIQQSAGFV